MVIFSLTRKKNGTAETANLTLFMRAEWELIRRQQAAMYSPLISPSMEQTTTRCRRKRRTKIHRAATAVATAAAPGSPNLTAP